jgi:hypothetical protein
MNDEWKVGSVLLNNEQGTRNIQYPIRNKKCKNQQLLDRLKNQTPATYSPDCSGKVLS